MDYKKKILFRKTQDSGPESIHRPQKVKDPAEGFDCCAGVPLMGSASRSEHSVDFN